MFYAKLLLSLVLISGVNNDSIANAGIDYPDADLPGDTPKLFASDILAVPGKNHHTCSFTADGRELYFSRYPECITMVMRYQNGQWTKPQEAFFKGWEAIISADGKKMIYGDGDLWIMERNDNGWSSPERMSSAINSETHDYYASTALNGTIYFSRFVGKDRANIFFSRPSEGEYTAIEGIAPNINKYTAYHPFISPDESFVLFNILDHPDGKGAADLFISFRNPDDSWCDPINLGESINTEISELCPTLTPDGKYLFFTRLTGNTGNVYWVGSEIIQKLKTQYIDSYTKEIIK